MDINATSDKAIAKELGSRIKGLRLRRNMTQQQLADASMLSLNTIKSIESGQGKLSTLIAVLRELNALDSLDSFIPDIEISPIELAKMHGHKRIRAFSKKRDTKKKSQGEN